MFRNNQKLFYSKLRGQQPLTINDPPPKEDISKFWNGVLGNKKEHNPQAEWLEIKREQMKEVDQDIWRGVNIGEVASYVKELKNWKSPGVNKIQNYWIKHLKALFPLLTTLIDEIITNPSSPPTWLNEGRTTLIYKKGDKNQANNYRLITCLYTLYKLITLLITERVYKHLTDNEILTFEQKRCRKRSGGCKY